MKKITLSFVLTLSLALASLMQAQNVSLVVNLWEDGTTGLPVVNHPVWITIKPANAGSYTMLRYSDQYGMVDTIFPNAGIGGFFIASTIGCDGNYYYFQDTITSTGNLYYEDTLILNCPAANCAAGFTHSINGTNPSQVDFTNTSSTPSGSSVFLHTTYQISYGDGSHGSDPNASHVYNNSGTFQVCMTITTYDSLYNNAVICQDTYCDSVTITAGPPVPGCNASFYSYVDTATRTGWFIDNSTVTNLPPGGSVEIVWNFPDSIATGQYDTVVYTFPQPGVHYIVHNLRMYDANHNLICSSFTGDSVFFPGTPASCNGYFNYTQSSTIPNEVTINIPSTAVQNIPAGGSASYVIDMGDGTVVTGQTSYTHTFASSGYHNVCVTAKALDSQGNEWCSNTRCRSVWADPLTSCNASFYLDSVNSGNGTVYIWNNASTNIPGGVITSYYWNFGDGTSSTQAFPTHVYSSPGTYNLCFAIGATNGSVSCIDTVCRTLYVDSLGNAHFKTGGPGFTLVVKDANTIGLDNYSVHTLEVFPNPAKDHLTITGSMEGDVNWQLIDMRGTLMHSGSARFNGHEEVGVDVSGFPRGLYILRVNNTNTTEHFKIKLDR